MWKILQHKYADDFVVATNQQKTIKDFIKIVSKKTKYEIKMERKRPQ